MTVTCANLLSTPKFACTKILNSHILMFVLFLDELDYDTIFQYSCFFFSSSEASAEVQMRRYVDASSAVINHIENLFRSRGLAGVLKFNE